MTSKFWASVAAVAILLGLAAAPPASAQQRPAASPAVKINARDIGGVVTSAHGPEAGVWVIARGNLRSPDPVHQDRRHRRQGPLCPA